MDREEADQTPAEEWKSSLNATCNRLSTQYLNLLRAASSKVALDMANSGIDPRVGGGTMKDANEPPPPALAADAEQSSLQAKLAAQNVCVASSNLLDLIRRLRLSALLMEESSIAAEEEEDCLDSQELSKQARLESIQLESELFQIRNSQI